MVDCPGPVGGLGEVLGYSADLVDFVCSFLEGFSGGFEGVMGLMVFDPLVFQLMGKVFGFWVDVG